MATAILAGAALSVRPAIVMALAAIATVGVISWSIPRLAIAVGLALMALPYTWSPTVLSIPLVPALVVSGVWIGVSLIQGGWRFRWHPIDFAVAAFVLAPAISALIVGFSYGLFWHTIANVAVPYAAVRLYLSTNDRSIAEFVPPALIGVGCAVAVLALVEVVLGYNPTTRVLTNPALIQWTHEASRAGFVRAQASFGQPIALGAFLLLPIGFAAVWPGKRLWWALALLLPAILFTFSRGPWIGLVAMLMLVLFTEKSIRGRLPSVLGLILLAGVVAWLISPVQEVIQQTFTTGTVEAGNAVYRNQLLGAAFQHLTFAGTPVTQAQTTGLLPGFKDLTSTLVLTMLRTGVLGLTALIALVLFAVRSLVTAIRTNDGQLRAISIVVISQLVVLVDVALITNYQYMFWLSVALLAVHGADHRRRSVEERAEVGLENPRSAT